MRGLLCFLVSEMVSSMQKISQGHLFLHCSHAGNSWNSILSKFRVQVVVVHPLDINILLSAILVGHLSEEKRRSFGFNSLVFLGSFDLKEILESSSIEKSFYHFLGSLSVVTLSWCECLSPFAHWKRLLQSSLARDLAFLLFFCDIVSSMKLFHIKNTNNKKERIVDDMFAHSSHWNSTKGTQTSIVKLPLHY